MEWTDDWIKRAVIWLSEKTDKALLKLDDDDFRHHNLHHLNYQCNFALYFRFWDKVMGTDTLEQEYDFLRPAVTGIVDAAEPAERGG